MNKGHEVMEWRPLEVSRGADLLVRCGHGAFVDENDDIVVVGGKNRDTFDTAIIELYTDKEGNVSCAKVNDHITNESVSKNKARFAFANTFCKDEQIFFMHGGFDNQCNYSGSRFLFNGPDKPSGIHTIPGGDYKGPSPRGYHSAIYVRAKDRPKSNVKTNSIFIFGGQCCVGGPYQFFNEVFRLDLTHLEWELLDCRGQKPSPRSQCFSFLWRSNVYVYGGYDGRNIFTDLHKLNLDNLEWTKVDLKGQGPPGMRGLSPLDFHIYFCQPSGVVIGNKLIILGESYETAKASIAVIDLAKMSWINVIGTSGLSDYSNFTANKNQLDLVSFNPPVRGNASLVLAKRSLFVVGGHVRDPNSGEADSRVWRLDFNKCMDWTRERILWIACYKNDRSECNLANCPPHIIYFIITLVNSNTFHIK